MLIRIALSVMGLLAALLLPASAALAQAQAWPSKPVRLIVPFPPGGGTDAFARPLAARLSQQLGQQCIIDSRGGAGGNIGADLAAKSAPDGYTFLFGAVHHTVAVSAYKNLAYDLEKDLVPITGVGYVPDIPTMAEAGVPGFESLSWYGLWAPAGTPRDIMLKLQVETAKALATPELKAIWALQGAEPGGEPSEQFAKLVHSEVEKWDKVVRQNKVTID